MQERVPIDRSKTTSLLSNRGAAAPLKSKADALSG